ncbi:MAG: CHRD domain-containing protein [Actinomycetota bacterium]|nr:CHRD domain-containing protein [Actinomycetota bacterium]
MLRRFGACLAVVSSILVATALPGTAAAHDDWNYGRAEFSIWLTPDQVQGGGDRGAIGAARLTFDEDQRVACYVIEWRNLEGDVTAAHLHAARRYDNGPHAIDFFNDRRYDGDHATVAGCVTSNRETIRDIIEHPSDFYLNIHTTRYEAGAIRGQLD